ncbi:hypothetical protein JMN32_03790 [Fulvivirga sp. 29W222]|uniref:CARDB domain-containing protein n=1 Tax=Fulvivirga marina TaxID=2494733 RepID=A0A937KCN6_9BACT|nr:CARDB domain-containing protein [Fulvivirga marina]MBL6445413.1 hypothetical protein [Fulvivirga marina]
MTKLKLFSILVMLLILQTACEDTNNNLINDPMAQRSPNPKIESQELMTEGAQYDLTIELGDVEHVNGGKSVSAGSQLRLDTYLTNLGPDPSPGRTPTSTAYLVGWYLSSDTIITTDDIRIGSFSGNSLNPDETVRFWADVQIPSDIQGGWYYWGAIVDYSDLLIETNEFNNTALGNQVLVH